ncbi:MULTISPECIES: toll/interleukin-1 receptor domain-containing protein [Bradyrhizobium]|uniref:toll/interleukin-1 receptor domain-containing protein n=1 Tax=Bradyrhizobium TaxID=374 RepID=UPI00057709ED|nr:MULTISPECIES: toll/interleukin-1 receptor domain-containing protein [unclassified Bradyrhizobium]MBR1328961.1 toll/interleukin-1 receptor domain-containing protein [Bradyrhizobium ottawaense]MBR1334816.1 toll/interleukin-1 receptor domain-containing protein [Bradyrhizobium ottawaense]
MQEAVCLQLRLVVKVVARIFLSYSKSDANFALQLAERLKSLGNEITVDVESLTAGQDWRTRLSEGLRRAELFVVLISQSSIRSPSVLQEIGAARAYAVESDRMLVIPVLIDDISIPSVVQDILVLMAADRDLDKIVSDISVSISQFVGRKAAKDERAAEVAKRIEINAASYIDDAVLSQSNAEARNRVMGIIWYVAGFISLLSGIAFAAFALAHGDANRPTEWTDLAVATLKGVVVIGLLAACARYAFSLGKSYVSEALKCSDRIHAIAFGKFYLQAYGDKATWVELKEVFQHWNIDRTSTFSSLDTAQIDPQILSLLGDVVKTAIGKAKSPP